MIILKVTRNQGFTLSLENTIYKKPQGEPHNLFRVKFFFTFENSVISANSVISRFFSL